MSSKTRVVKIQRKNGEIVQDCDVYIGRACNMGGWNLKESKWHNPYNIKQYGSVDIVIDMYEKYIRSRQDLMNSLPELMGKTLGCWCKKSSKDKCHGDILVKLLTELK